MTVWEGILDGPLMDVLGWTLIHSLWQGVLIALGLAAALRLVPRRFANTRYSLAGLALTACLVFPLLTFLHLQHTPPAALAASLAVVADSGGPVLAGAAPTVDGSWLALLFPWLTHCWLLGVLLLSTKMALEYRQVRRLVGHDVRPVAPELLRQCAALAEALGVRRGWRLLESLEVDVPMVIGWFHPVILLPAAIVTGLKPEQIAMILSHELAHVRRHDYLVNLVQTAAEILLFFHPAVWWISRQMRNEREHCCDDIAVGLCRDPIGYARTLADTEELRHTHRAFAVAATGGDLKLRVTRLFSQHTCHPNWGSRSLVALCLMGLLLGTGLAARVQATVKPMLAPEPMPAPAASPKPSPVLPVAAAEPRTTPVPHTVASPTKPLVQAPPVAKASALQQLAQRLHPAAPVVKKPTAKPLTPVLVAETTPARPAPVQLASLKPVSAPRLPEVRSAVAVATPAPDYPSMAKRAGWEAEVAVRFVVESDGRVAQVEFADPELRPAFRKAVQNALQQWRYEPRREDGQAVAEARTRVFSFSLSDGSECKLITGSRICR